MLFGRLENFEVELKSDGMHFTWKLRPVPSSALSDAQPVHYGIQLAKILDFPADVMQRAEAISNSIDTRTIVEPPLSYSVIDGIGQMDNRQLFNLAQKLLCLAVTQQDLSEDQLLTEVQSLQQFLKP